MVEMIPKKDFNRLYKAYNKLLPRLKATISIRSADENLSQFMIQLQFLRDCRILLSEDVEHDYVVNSIQNTLVAYSNYILCKEKLQELWLKNKEITKEIKQLNFQKDTYYCKFWQLLSHNFEVWFE